MRTRASLNRRVTSETHKTQRPATIDEDTYYHSATSDKSDEEDASTLISPTPVKKVEDPAAFRKKVMERTIMAFAMVGFYMIMITSSHLYCILTGVIIQVL